MADYDDAESPVNESRGGPRAVSRARGPIGKAWAWFSAQPAQTKVIVIGVAVVLGVIVWMALRKRSANSQDNMTADSSEIPTKPTEPVGAPPSAPAPPIPLGGGYQPGPQPTTGPGQSGPTGIATQPTAAPAVARWRVTPGGVSDPYTNYNVNNAGHRQGIAITGPLNN